MRWCKVFESSLARVLQGDRGFHHGFTVLLVRFLEAKVVSSWSRWKNTEGWGTLEFLGFDFRI